MADDLEKEAENGDAPKKKSKALLFGIIGVLVLLLGGGGFFAYTKFMKPAPAVSVVKLKQEKVNKIGVMVPLDPFVVNLSDPSGKRYLKLEITLELGDNTTADKLKPYTPKIRDMVIMFLTSLTFDEVMTPEGKIRIRDELLARFNMILRPNKIKNIYFTNFVIQ
ncbi:MAG TPA: flagellar basal body-associated FliL family protein [Desulfobacterales bacterium]|nr:flagellar basal body-associated FliL family protein [Desulfobacterales bacterium]